MENLDVVILVYACYTHDKYKKQIETINSTWGKQHNKQFYKNVKILYFLGEEIVDGFSNDSAKPSHIQYINLIGVNNDYLSASYKQFLGMKYVYENYNAKFTICIGTDTYLNIPKLLSYIDNFNYEDCLYIGGHGCERQIGAKKYYFHSGGPGFIITNSVLKTLYDFLPNLMDHWIDVCHKNNVDDLIPACDVAISYYLQQPGTNTTIIKTNDLSFTNCNYRGWPCHQHEIKMENIISCHLMSEEDFYNFTQILNENNHFL
jgi:hypothetical protein